MEQGKEDVRLMRSTYTRRKHMMKVGILGAGGIARKMAATLNGMTDVTAYAIASRDIEKSRAFAAEFGIEKAYGSYEEMLSDDRVELVYIAVPHSHHHEWTIKALKAGRNVLCEKAFAANAAQAEEMIALSEEKGFLLAEAIWTRYMPSRRMIESIINSGEIGEVKCIDSNLGYRISQNKRLTDPALAGGCLLDLGVYNLNFSSMVTDAAVATVDARMVPTETGVDGQDSVTLTYENGIISTMFNTMYALTDRRGLITGTDGFIVVENINDPERIRGYGPGGELKKDLTPPPQITGFEYQVLACKKAIEEKKTECEDMPHSEILKIMRLMDRIRQIYGIRFPFE